MGLIKSFIDGMLNKSSVSEPEYDLNSVDGIRSIPVKSFLYDPQDGNKYAYNNIEYVLQRKATEHKKNGNLNLAIECLKKANDIMPLSDMVYPEKEYLRLASYLKIAKRFDEAREIEEKYSHISENLNKQVMKITKNNASELETDLIEMTSINSTRCCSECYKNQNRIFSITGNDTRFPKLPDYLLDGSHCGHQFYPFVYGISYMTDKDGKTVGDPIKYSNRPFIDDRTEEEKQAYADYIHLKQQDVIDK